MPALPDSGAITADGNYTFTLPPGRWLIGFWGTGGGTIKLQKTYNGQTADVAGTSGYNTDFVLENAQDEDLAVDLSGSTTPDILVKRKPLE